MAYRPLILFFAVVALCCGVRAQTPNPEPTTKEPQLPIVTFDFALEGSTPPHFSIAVEPDGKATYRGDGSPAPGAPMQPYVQQFLVSQPTRKQIFDLATALNCFQGDFEYHGGRIANTGAKTLRCTYADRESQTTYNYSRNPQLQMLTTIFQDIGNTMEFAQRLQYLQRHDKLGLEAELKSMEEFDKSKRLGELQAVAPLLEQIVNDTAIMNVSRRRAEHLLQRSKSSPAARAAVPH